MNRRTRLFISLLVVGALIGVSASASSDKRTRKQAELDQACEAARQEKIAPMRQEFVRECVEEQQFETHAACETFFADYGARSGTRAPLFYNLPPCVEAFDYQQSERRSD